MKKIFIGVYNPTIILTYIGVFCATAAIGLLLSPLGGHPSDTLDAVMILLILAGGCDMFDGAVARQFKRTEQEKQFGIQLDSLADTVSFVALPAATMLFITGFRPLCIAIACFYIFAGIMRLGWFNVTTEENRGFYQGLPVTFSALIFPACYLLLRLLGENWLLRLYPAAVACVGLLFILNFRLKKPGMRVLIWLALPAIAVITGLLVL